MFRKKKINESLLLDNIANEHKENDSSINLPSMVLIGYYEGISKKALFETAKGYVNKYFDNPYTAQYRFKKHSNGYIYEIHDGEKNYSYIDNIINSLAANGSCYLLTRNKTIKVMEFHGKIQSYVMPSEDVEIIGDKIQPSKAKTTKLYTEGGGLLMFGLSVAFMGVFSLFLSSLFKYVILAEKKSIEYHHAVVESPLGYYEKLAPPTATTYTSRIIFNNGKWNTVLGSNPLPNIEEIKLTEEDIKQIEQDEYDSLENKLLKKEIDELKKVVLNKENVPVIPLNSPKEIIKKEVEQIKVEPIKKTENNKKVIKEVKVKEKEPKINLKNLPSNVVLEKS